MLPIWRKLAAIQWPTPIPTTQWEPNFAPAATMEGCYTSIWQSYEDFANHSQPRRLQQLGRATAMEVEWKIAHQAPVEPNRKGDIQSQLDTTNLKHSRWTKQIRRLEHFARCPAEVGNRPNLVEHKASLWHKILAATGFTGGFLHWWINLPKRFESSPAFLPTRPPTQDDANAIFLEFSHHYRTLETSLMQTRKNMAIQRRADDPYIIYQDLRKEPAEPVQTIVQQHHMSLQTIEISDTIAKITLDAPLPAATQAIMSNGIPIAASIHDSCTLSVDAEIAQAEPTFTCQHVEADVLQILDAFQKEWIPRWTKQSPDQTERWQVITDFAKHAIPKRETTFPTITLETWKREVERKKRKAAVGPDGISREDLLHLPDSLVQEILLMFAAIESGAPWPVQAVTGIVTLLAKTAQASTTNQYRPICVFSLCYRIWSSIRAKQCLRFLRSVVPTTLLGNIPGRSPKHLWYHTQEIIEFFTISDQTIAGGVIDIVKCFNALHREPLLAIASHLGIPANVITLGEMPWPKCKEGFQSEAM